MNPPYSWIWACFNTNIVELKGLADGALLGDISDFNTNIVELKALLVKIVFVSLTNFNTNIVELKGAGGSPQDFTRKISILI